MPKQPTRKTLHVITKYFYTPSDDMEEHIVSTYNALDPKEWNITIHASTNTASEENILKKREMIGDILVRRSESGFFGFSPHVRWEKADLICLYDFRLFPHLFVLCTALWLKITGKKKFALMIVPFGGFNPYWKQYHPVKRAAKQLYHRILGRFLINLTADGVLASSKTEKRELRIAGIRKELIAVIPSSVETEAYEKTPNRISDQIKKKVTSYGTYFLQIGKIHSVKNYETALIALTYLPNTVNLVIAGPIGDPSYYEQLKILAAKYDVTNQVIFHKTVRSYDKFYLIRHARALLHIPHWDPFGTVVIEAMTQGTLSIVADSSAASDIVEDEVNGYIVKPTDELTIGKRLNTLLKQNNAEKTEQMRARCVRTGNKYRTHALMRKMEILYSSVLIRHKYPYRLKINKSLPL